MGTILKSYSEDKLQDILNRKKIKNFEEIKSISSIQSRLLEELNLFCTKLKGKIPLSVKTNTNNELIITIDRGIKKYHKSNVKLILSPKELQDGIRLARTDPSKVILEYLTRSIEIDRNRLPKYRRAYSKGEPLYEVYNALEGYEVPLYEVHPSFLGDVNYEYLNSDVKKLLILRKSKEDNKWVKEFIDDSVNLPDLYDKYYESNIDLIKRYCFVKVKECKKSSELGFGKLKKKMMESNECFNIADILFDFVSKKDGLVRDIVEVIYNNRTYKFLGEELEFIYPDLDILTKGYNLPKDRTFKIGKTAKVINDKHTKLPLKAIVKIESHAFKDYYKVSYDNTMHIIAKKQLKIV